MNKFRGYFHSKSNFRQKSTHPNVHRGPPMYWRKSLTWNNFLGAFCHWGKFIFLKSTLNSASFDTHQPHHNVKKNVWPLYRAWPRKTWPFLKRSLDQKSFVLLFLVLLCKNEQTLGVFSFKIKFSFKIDPPYYTRQNTFRGFGTTL
jgi:hypothetical protein